MYLKTSFVVLCFAHIRLSLTFLRACRPLSGGSGVCLPKDDCYTPSKRVFSQCGRNICCLDPEIAINECMSYARKIFGDTCPELRIPQTKIIGGSRVEPMEFPHMAAVGFEQGVPGNISWLFGGTVISPNYVLTAAHGFKYYKMLSTKVLAGAVDLNDSSAQLRTVARTVIHPKYATKDIGFYDVALLALDKPLMLSPSIVPACLMNEEQVARAYTVIATGWGIVNQSSTKIETHLRKVELEKINDGVCRDQYLIQYRFDALHSSVICAGDLRGGRDTCQGDSGGPLSIRINHLPCVYGIIGITVGGSGCGYANSPGIYSRISYHISWIVNEVWLQ